MKNDLVEVGQERDGGSIGQQGPSNHGACRAEAG